MYNEDRVISRQDRRELIKEETPNLIEEDESPKLKQTHANRLAGKIDGEMALKKLGDE